jgi:hypothetical protein
MKGGDRGIKHTHADRNRYHAGALLSFCRRTARQLCCVYRARIEACRQ